ncbi:MAG: hypothetical protein OEM51_11505 [Gammaproteobacteria bacterium]|nr:hypothetical protein [Gammaproteobacteria bacterium]
MSSYRLFCIILSATVFSACSNTTSENVTTQGIHADIDVFANGTGRTFVDAELEVGHDGLARTSLELSPGDRLTVTANGIQKTMIEDMSVIGRFRYAASFDFDDAGTMFTVSFTRDSGVSAPNSNVTLPEGFLVQSPTSNDVLAQADNVPIAWTPSGTSIVPDIEVSLSCATNSGLVFTDTDAVTLSSDTGVASFPVAAVIPIGTLDTSRLCEGEVRFSRWRRGNLDPDYGEGGSITAEHIERAQFFVDLRL